MGRYQRLTRELVNSYEDLAKRYGSLLSGVNLDGSTPNAGYLSVRLRYLNTELGQVRRYATGNAIQHAFGHAMIAYYHTGVEGGIALFLGDQNERDAINNNPTNTHLHIDSEADMRNNRVGQQVGNWMQENGLAFSEVVDILAFLDDNMALNYVWEHEPQSGGEVGISGGVYTSGDDIIALLNEALANNKSWTGASADRLGVDGGGYLQIALADTELMALKTGDTRLKTGDTRNLSWKIPLKVVS
jgi:hypothetical protein